MSLVDGEVGEWRHDLEISAELADSLLWAVGMLRSGVNARDRPGAAPQAGDWLRVVSDLGRLGKRVEGARRAAVRAYAEASGEALPLGIAMGVDAVEVEALVRELEGSEPEAAEVWARASGASRPS